MSKTNKNQPSTKLKWIYIGIGAIILMKFGHSVARVFETTPSSNKQNIIERLNDSASNFSLSNVFLRMFTDWQPTLASIYVACIFLIIYIYAYSKMKKFFKNDKFRPGVEHGSAKFLTIQELNEFSDKLPENNMLFTKNGKMGLYNKRLPFNKQMNKNVLVIGDSGAGKSHTYLKPNAMQLTSSYVFTDTKGLLVKELGSVFKENGYKVKVFDLITFLNSNQFNVFKYIKSEREIDEYAEAIVVATQSSENKGEDFWVKAELQLMRALLAYLYTAGQVYDFEPNLGQVGELIRNLDKVNEDDMYSPLEKLFEDLNRKKPNTYAYRKFKMFNESFKSETRNSVKAVISARFSVFEHNDVKRLLERDTMNIEEWKIDKYAVFINIPEISDAFKFISALLFTTIFKKNIEVADKLIKGEIKKENKHLQIFADECAQIGKIPKLAGILATIRSREISAKLMLQDIPQLETVYGKSESKTILNNCACLLYLGTNDEDTAKYLSFRAGNETIKDRNHNKSFGKNGSTSENNSKLKRELITAHEIFTLPMEDALLYIGKQNVFRDKKYNPFEHPNAKYLASSPSDDYWYDYEIAMNQSQDVILNTLPGKISRFTSEEVDERMPDPYPEDFLEEITE